MGTLPTKKYNARIFLSWSHGDRERKEALLKLLLPRLAILKDISFEWWQDSHLLPGEELTPEIKARIREADFALQLVSPNFLSSDFIRKHELAPFFTSNKYCLPVSLVYVNLGDGRIDWGGVNKRLVFHLDSKSFHALGEAEREDFATALVDKIAERVLRVNGVTTPWARL